MLKSKVKIVTGSIYYVTVHAAWRRTKDRTRAKSARLLGVL